MVRISANKGTIYEGSHKAGKSTMLVPFTEYHESGWILTWIQDWLKNGLILPTGQWYAPSAVINDALIMPENARVCQSMPEYARI